MQMGKFASFEQKLMATARGVIVLLGVVFLVFAIWWAVLSVSTLWNGMGSDSDGDAQRVSAAQAFSPDAAVFQTAIKQAQAGNSGVDTDTFKLREAMKLPEYSAHYDKVIQGIRRFAEGNAAQRARIEAKAEEDSETLMAPAAFEAIDKYGTLCVPHPEDAATAASAAGDEEELSNPNCGKVTVREIIVDNLSSVLSQVDSDAHKLSLHKAYIAGLDQSVSDYLDGKVARDDLFALSTAQIARALVAAYGDPFSEKMRHADTSDDSGIAALLKGASPLALLTNPFVAGTLGFLLFFAYVMMMLSMTRIERHLRKD